MAMTTESTELPLEGTLSDFSLAEILRVLSASSFTGALHLGDGNGVWLNNGDTYLAESSGSSPLSDVLFSAEVGPITYIEVLLNSSAGVAKQLVEENPSTEHMVRRLLVEHTLGALFELLVPSNDSFFIAPGDVHPIGLLASLPTEVLIERTFQRVEVWKQIAASIPNTDFVFKLNPEMPDGAEARQFTAEEWRYVSLLDGRNTVADLINKTGESAFAVCSGLYRLLLEGLVIK